MIRIPKAFTDTTIDREGEAGRAWLEALPQTIEHLTERWNVTIDGPVMHGYLAVAIPVLRNSSKRILKVSWLDSYSEHEARELEAWDGNGAVQLFESDEALGAMLLERLDSNTTLESLPPDQAIQIAGSLLQRLSIKAPSWARSISDEVDVLSGEIPSDWERNDRPFAYGVVEKALLMLEGLRVQSRNLLVNHDLHYGNVLAGEREPWLVIDPKVLAGDPEYAAAPLLWQQFAAIDSNAVLEKRLSILTESAGLDRKRTRDWTYVRAVSTWLWGLNMGLTEDPKRCQRLVEWL